MATLLTHDDGAVSARKRKPIDPTPRFQPDRSKQVDSFLGCLEEQVPKDHLARAVWAIVEQLDTAALESQYSALGRRGYHPKRLLAVWVYASLIGMHHSTKVALACKTDAAFRWLCGGGCPSGPTLRRMRMKQAGFFAVAIEQTVLAGHAAGLVELDALAVDAVRIRAHASKAAVRTKRRSTRRLKELAEVDVQALDSKQREKHDARIRKHQDAVSACERRGVTSIVTTNELAALMKFPSGANAPAHRATVIASGSSARFVIGVLVDADPNDQGKLRGALEHARDLLDRLGLRNGDPLTVAADAGYFCDRDLQFAQEVSEWADVLIAENPSPGKYPRMFRKEQFTIREDGTAICPARTKMLGPYPNNKEHTEFKWVGVGCSDCALKPRCTRGQARAIQINPDKERARRSMKERMAQPGAKERYNQRIATVEPIFAFLEEAMGFRRASSRDPRTVVSEIFLKVLAYNIDRLIRAEREAERLSCAFFIVALDGTYQSPPALF